eukprot:g10494.t1
MALICRLQKQQFGLEALPEEYHVTEAVPIVSIGRTADNVLHAEDKTISKQHCTLELHFTRSPSFGADVVRRHLFLRDNSSFGTYVNEVKLGKGSALTLIPHNGLIALRRPKMQEGGGGFYNADFKCVYEANMQPMGDEILLDEQGQTVGPAVQVPPPAPGQQVGGPGASTVAANDSQLRPFAPLMPTVPGQTPVPPVQAAAGGNAAAAGVLGAGAGAMVPQSPIMIPANMAGLIVGRSGETIMRICEQSGARLDITKDKHDIDAEGQKAINVLDGAPEQVALARQIINDIITAELANKGEGGKYSKGKKGHWGAGKDYYGGGGGKKGWGKEQTGLGAGGKEWGSRFHDEAKTLTPIEGAEVVVAPSHMIGVLIGKGGETINRIKGDTGVQIEIGMAEEGGDSNLRAVQIHGAPPEQIAQAKQVVEDLFADAQSRAEMKGQHKGGMNPNGAPLGSKGSSYHGGNKGSPQHPPGTVIHHHEREVPSDVVGLLIGHKGETIRKIQNDTQCRVEVDKTRGTPGVTQVVVFEAPDMAMIEHAVKAMDEVIRPVIEARIATGEGGTGEGGAVGGTGTGAATGEAAITSTLLNNQNQEENAVTKAEDGTFVCHFSITETQMQLIIGEDSATIQRLGSESGAELSIVKVGQEGDAAEFTCIIKGLSEEVVQRGKELVEEVLGTSTSNKGRGRRERGVYHAFDPQSNPTDDHSAQKGYNSKGSDHKGSSYGDDRKGGKFGGKYNHDHKGGGKQHDKDRGHKGGKGKQQEEKRKLYVDEMSFPRRHVASIHPEEMEVFVSGMRTDVGEADLWKCLCAVGASDVAEILLLKDPDRGEASKGMAYVLFTSQAHAAVAVQKLSQRPLHVGVNEIATDALNCRWSESERVLRGNNGSYREELIGKLMGKKAVRMQEIQQKIGCNRAILTGRGMKGHGTTDDCTRLHLVLCCAPGTTTEMVEAAKPVWLEQLTYAFSEPNRHPPPQQNYGPGGAFIPPQQPNGQVIVIPPTAAPGHPPILPPGVPPGAVPVAGPPGAGRHHVVPGPGHHLPPGAQIVQPGAGPAAAMHQVVVQPDGQHVVVQQPMMGAPAPQMAAPQHHLPGGAPPAHQAGAPHLAAHAGGVVGGAVAVVPGAVGGGMPPGAGVVLDAAAVQQAPATSQLKIPLVIKRVDTETGKRYCESVALVGSELRWQPWCPEVGGESWKAYPLRWGKEGQLFVILQHRETGEIKLCVVEEKLRMENWKTVVAPPLDLFSARNCVFKPFNLDGKSFLACVDRANRKLIMYKIRDPNEAWETCYEETLNDPENPNSMPFSEFAKIHIFYSYSDLSSKYKDGEVEVNSEDEDAGNPNPPPAKEKSKRLYPKPFAIVHDLIPDSQANERAEKLASENNGEESSSKRKNARNKFYKVPVLFEIVSGRSKWRKVEREGVVLREPTPAGAAAPGADHAGSSTAANNKEAAATSGGRAQNLTLPLPQTKFRMWPVYMRTATMIEVFLFCIDVEQKELRIIYVPREGAADHEWHIVSRKSFSADTRLSLLYIAGKPEPMCMSLSAQTNTACLFKVHLHLVLPPVGRTAKEMPIPHRAIMDELFRRDIGNLLEGHPAYVPPTAEELQANSHPAPPHHLIPVDTSADLACSQAHPWISYPLKEHNIPRPPALLLPASSAADAAGGNQQLPRSGPFGDSKDSSAEGSSEGDGARDEQANKGMVPGGAGELPPFDSSPFEDDGEEKGPFGGQKRENPFDDGKFHLGDDVEANWRRRGKWFVGRITGIAPDGSYNLDFEGGFTDSNVWESNIRPLSIQNSTFKSWKGPKDSMVVKQEMLGLIIGSKGATVKEMERDFNVKIIIGKDHLGPDDVERKDRDVCVIADTIHALQDCFARINGIIKSAAVKEEMETRRKIEMEEERKRREEEMEQKRRDEYGEWGRSGRKRSRERGRSLDRGGDLALKRRREDDGGVLMRPAPRGGERGYTDGYNSWGGRGDWHGGGGKYGDRYGGGYNEKGGGRYEDRGGGAWGGGKYNDRGAGGYHDSYGAGRGGDNYHRATVAAAEGVPTQRGRGREIGREIIERERREREARVAAADRGERTYGGGRVGEDRYREQRWDRGEPDYARSMAEEEARSAAREEGGRTAEAGGGRRRSRSR